jgi:hypothetical protein
MILPPEFKEFIPILVDGAQRSSRLADFHSTICSLANGIEPHNEFTAIAENVDVRSVPSFVASVYPNLETVDDALRHETHFTQSD